MKYIRPDKCQSANFSCLEELKCDIIENLLSLINSNTNECIQSISVFVDIDKAFELSDKLIKSNVNGFYFYFDKEFETEDLSQEKVVKITLCTDGTIWIDKLHENYYYDDDFTYIDADINSFWLQKIDNGENDILIFDME